MKLAFVLVVFMILACTPYWVTTDPNYLPARIEITEVDDPSAFCHKPSGSGRGCARRVSRELCIVEVKKSLPRDKQKCVAMHEIIGHCLGRDHPNDPQGGPATDCGDGTMM